MTQPPSQTKGALTRAAHRTRDVAVLYALTYHLTHVIPVALVATTVYLVRSRRHRS